MNICGYRMTLVGVCLLFLVPGCSPKDMAQVELPIPDAKEEIPEKSRAQIVKVACADATSPAVSDAALPGPDASPAAVCERFLLELNRENSQKFELLLTPSALNVSNRLDFDLPPVADTHAKFRLGEPRFASIRNKVCFIDTEFDSEGTETNKISWMLRKSNVGWRVAGMLVPGTNEEVSNLLSFENAVDIAQIRDSLTEEISTDSQPD